MSAQPRLSFLPEDATVAGVDEAGRGPLAGPVIAAAVILDPHRPVPGLRDSKLLSAKKRNKLARQIRQNAKAFAVAAAAPREIDGLNILQATLLAMERAVQGLGLAPDVVKVDGKQLPRFSNLPYTVIAEPIVQGDRLVAEISAASILAKVCRDRLMHRWHRRYPDYGFDRNKGYGTSEHLAAIAEHGPCPLHRRSFSPVKETPAP